MNDELNDLEGSDHSLIEELFRYFRGETEENHQKKFSDKILAEQLLITGLERYY
jgi:hypothetical protein